MNKLVNVITEEREMVLNSREVAEMIGKRHDHLLRDIRNYIEFLGQAKIGESDFFIESSYVNSQNKTQPCYKLTKMGCEMVGNKLTGEKGTIFTAKYVKRFNDMEKHITKQIKPMNSIELLELQFKVLKEQEVKIKEVENKVDDLENNMPLFSVDCKEIQALVRKVGISVLGGYKSTAYNNKSIRGKVYSDIHSQLKREFGVQRYEAIKRSEISKAKEILKEYKAPLYIKEMVKALNDQIGMVY